MTGSDTTITTDTLQTNAAATHTGSLTVTADKSGESIQLNGPDIDCRNLKCSNYGSDTTITTDALQTNAGPHIPARSP